MTEFIDSIEKINKHLIASEDNRQEIKAICQNFIEDLLSLYHFLFNTKDKKGTVKFTPTEVEIYMYRDNTFEDPYTHRSKYQSDRETKQTLSVETKYYVYFHPAGLDIVFSNRADTCFSVLLRSGSFDNDKEIICGPLKLKKQLLSHWNLISKNKNLNENSTVSCRVVRNKFPCPINEKELIVLGPRYGINHKIDEDPIRDFIDMPLRGVYNLKQGAYKDKERLATYHVSHDNKYASKKCSEQYRLLTHFLNSRGKTVQDKLLAWRSEDTCE